LANEEQMETTRPGEDDDAFALRLSWDDADDDARAREPSPPRHLEDRQNGSGSSPAPGDPADPIGPGVHDLVTRVELRQIGVALGELRREVADLRTGVAALLEDRTSTAGDHQSIDDVRADIAALHDDLNRRLPEDPTSAIPELRPVVDEIVALRADMVALKRRIAVRASAAGDATGDQADQIARLVAERLAGLPPKPAR
jgi:hypothetical protein